MKYRWKSIAIGGMMLSSVLAFGGSSNAAPVTQQATPFAVSTFDTDAEGWTTTYEPPSTGTSGGTIVQSYEPTGGNPGGAIAATDVENPGPPWFWVAPAKFLGNISSNYDESLTFEIRASQLQTPNRNLPAVIMKSGNTVLTYTTPFYPTTNWTKFRVVFNERSWNRVIDSTTTRPATKEELQAVMSNLTTLYIRGEYNEGPDVGYLDNVVLGSPNSSVYLPMVMR